MGKKADIFYVIVGLVLPLALLLGLPRMDAFQNAQASAIHSQGRRIAASEPRDLDG